MLRLVVPSSLCSAKLAAVLLLRHPVLWPRPFFHPCFNLSHTSRLGIGSSEQVPPSL